MGEIAEMMLDGTLCQCCGEYIGDSSVGGIPEYCASCAKDARQDKGISKPTSHNNGSTSPSEIADSIEAACFPVEGEYIVPRKKWLLKWVRQLRACR